MFGLWFGLVFLFGLFFSCCWDGEREVGALKLCWDGWDGDGRACCGNVSFVTARKRVLSITVLAIVVLQKFFVCFSLANLLTHFCLNSVIIKKRAAKGGSVSLRLSNSFLFSVSIGQLKRREVSIEKALMFVAYQVSELWAE